MKAAVNMAGVGENPREGGLDPRLVSPRLQTKYLQSQKGKTNKIKIIIRIIINKIIK